MAELTCTVRVPSLCGKPAAEVLHVRDYPWNAWTEAPRCADHPAEDWVAMIRHVSPLAEVRIEKL